MGNYRLTIWKTRISFNPDNINIHRWRWSLDRKDGTIGYTDHGESCTKIGAYMTARYRLRKEKRPITKDEYDL